MQTFKLYTAQTEFVITDETITNALRVNSTEDLLRLRRLLNTYIDQGDSAGPLPEQSPLTAPDSINSVQAREVAQAMGINIAADIIKIACQRGNIAGASKNGGRWSMSRSAFLDWLQDYRQRKAH